MGLVALRRGCKFELRCWRWQASTLGASADPLVMVHAFAPTFFIRFFSHDVYEDLSLVCKQH